MFLTMYSSSIFPLFYNTFSIFYMFSSSIHSILYSVLKSAFFYVIISLGFSKSGDFCLSESNRIVGIDLFRRLT